MLNKSDLSQTLSTLGKPVTFQNWIGKEGPNGGRLVIDYFDIYVEGTITVADANWPGEDVARIVSNIRIEQKDGTVRYALAGDLSRVQTYATLGAPATFEHADVAIGALAPVAYCWQVCMRKPYAHTPGDFALAVEEFKRIVIDTNTLANAVGPTGATTLTVPSLTFYVVANVREEFDVRIKCTDVVAYEDFKSTTQGKFTIGGKIHDLILHAARVDGGASLANLTDVNIDALNFPTLTRLELLMDYRRKRDAGNNLSTTQAAQLRSDPFVFPGAAEKASAVLLHDHETSAWAGKIIDDTILVKCTNTVASLRGITRVVVPTSQEARNRTLALYGLTPAALRVATDAKSSRDVADWPKPLIPYLPLKGDLPNAA